MSNMKGLLAVTSLSWLRSTRPVQWVLGLWRTTNEPLDSLAHGGEINHSGLKPSGRAVLVKPYRPEITKGVIIIPDTVKEGHQMREVRGTVIAVGPEAWKDEACPRAEPGDKVLVSQWVGVILQGTADGEFYRMVNAEDIYCRITEETV